jgi:spore maturation protein B
MIEGNDIATQASTALFLLFVVGIPLYGYFKGVKVYEVFVEGAKEGFEVAVTIIPYLVAIFLVVGMVRASGAVNLLAAALPDWFRTLGLNPEVLSLILMRPLSGGASLGILGEIVSTYGADSFPSRLAAVIVGSTETTFYVIAVYFGAVAVTRVRYALHAGLLADAVGVLASIGVCWLVFR